MLYLKEGSFDIPPEAKVIKADLYAAYLQAEEIIKLAQDKAAQTHEEAKQAYADEKERGYNEGLEEGNQKISELMIDAVAKSVKNFEEFENEIIKVVIEAVKKIVGEMDERERVSRVVNNALEQVRNQKKVSLLVNPQDYEVVHSQLDAILKEFPSITFIDVDQDQRIEAGGCKLETEMGVVDASLKVQLESIEKSLVKAIK